MYGKYHDSRVYQHLVHTYSRVPYLDHEIYNVENVALRESRRANQRALIAQQGTLSLTQACKGPNNTQKYSPTPSETLEIERIKMPRSLLSPYKKLRRHA